MPPNDDEHNVETSTPPAPRAPSVYYNGKFLLDDIDLTFVLLELQVESTAEADRFRALLGILPKQVLQQIRDILPNLRMSNQPYTELKNTLLVRLGESDCDKVRKLLTNEKLGDRLPSVLLADMLALLDGPPIGQCIQIVRQLFMQKLPAQLQYQLATIDPSSSLQELATMADRITKAQSLTTAAVSSPHQGSIQTLQLGQDPHASVSQVSPVANLASPYAQGLPNINALQYNLSHTAQLESRITYLEKNIFDLTERLRTLEARPSYYHPPPPPPTAPAPFPYSHYPRSSSQSRRYHRRPNTPTRQPSAQQPQQIQSQTSPPYPTHNPQGICVNHQRWGDQTRTCLKPCTFPLNTNAT